MIQPLISAVVAFGLTFALLLLVESGWHRLRHNSDKSYRWGVWLFAILAGIYVFLTSLGRG